MHDRLCTGAARRPSRRRHNSFSWNEHTYWWLGFMKAPFWYPDRLLRRLHLLPQETGGPHQLLADNPVAYVCSNLWMATMGFGEARVDAQGQVFFGPESIPGPRVHLPGLVALRAELLMRGRRNELRMGDNAAWIVLERCDEQGIHVKGEVRMKEDGQMASLPDAVEGLTF